MKCTDCKKEVSHTVSGWKKYNGKRLVSIIRDDEALCYECAKKRGFGGLAEIYKQREREACA